MPIFVVPPPPPPPDLWDSWIREARDAMSGLQWRAGHGELGRWFTASGEPTQIVKTTPEDGREAIALLGGRHAGRYDVLISEQAAKIACEGVLSAERSTTIEYNGTEYAFRLRWTGEYVELAAVAV